MAMGARSVKNIVMKKRQVGRGRCIDISCAGKFYGTTEGYNILRKQLKRHGVHASFFSVATTLLSLYLLSFSRSQGSLGNASSEALLRPLTPQFWAGDLLP
jgi:hypothetical protein